MTSDTYIVQACLCSLNNTFITGTPILNMYALCHSYFFSCLPFIGSVHTVEFVSIVNRTNSLKASVFFTKHTMSSSRWCFKKKYTYVNKESSWKTKETCQLIIVWNIRETILFKGNNYQTVSIKTINRPKLLHAVQFMSILLIYLWTKCMYINYFFF